MKDPYQQERSKARARELPDTFEREPLDFHTEEERNRIDTQKKQHLAAELAQIRETRRQWLADEEANKQAAKQALITRHERWLAAWHIGLLIGGIIALIKIIESLIANGT